MEKFYPVAIPILNGNEKKYVNDCLDTAWISSNGSYIEKFEHQFAEFCHTKHAITCSNGTTALHLALLAHGVKKDDEVIIPTFTFVATANAVAYCGAKPVFVDAEPETWNLNPGLIEEKITSHTKGIIAVHLYGHPADMEPILAIAQKYKLFVMEDAAEALGAKYKGNMIGSLGDSATFSLFGNKMITTGEGGMITTNNDDFAALVRLLKGHGADNNRRYWYPQIGYNYRMTNLQAAIGFAQIENINWHLEQRIRVARLYHKYLQDIYRITLPIEKSWAKNSYWMYSVLLSACTEQKRNEVMDRMMERGIETRPFFYPMHVLPIYKDLQSYNEFPVANRISIQGLNLPSYGVLTEEDIRFISLSLIEVLTELKMVE